MSTTQPFVNRLLARLSERDYERLKPSLTAVLLSTHQVLCAADTAFEHVYFPTRGCVSAVKVMENGDAIEIGTIGHEGMVGLPLVMGVSKSSVKVFIQVEGTGVRMSAARFKQELAENEEFRKLMLRYSYAFLNQVTQTAACNGLHKVSQRCCRWILETHDRYMADVIPLTHEFLGVMIGVRRSSVTEVLGPLQAQGLISCKRGTVTILNRKGLEAFSCECYASVRDTYVEYLGKSMHDGRI